MGWFKKKEVAEEELPELPELPDIESVLPRIEKKESQIPQFSRPRTEMIKGDREISLSPLPPIHRDLEMKRSIEMPKKSEFLPQMMKSSPKESKKETLPTTTIKKNEPIFVRIDKFELALENIKNIKKKVEEMESLLTNLRQVNAKEDLELSEWEREIHGIKSKIESIDTNLFSKLG